jgi:hypothetical protein
MSFCYRLGPRPHRPQARQGPVQRLLDLHPWRYRNRTLPTEFPAKKSTARFDLMSVFLKGSTEGDDLEWHRATVERAPAGPEIRFVLHSHCDFWSLSSRSLAPEERGSSFMLDCIFRAHGLKSENTRQDDSWNEKEYACK